MREAAESIARAAIEAVKPEVLIPRAVSLDGSLLRVHDLRIDLSHYRRIIVVGAGKATAAMAHALEGLLQERISGGVIVVPYDLASPLRNIEIFEAGHPIPDERGFAGAQALLSLLRHNAAENVLFVCLISGGGSALLPYPAEGVSLSDKQSTTKLLLECGATIAELNTVRKHLSKVKGGQLARAAAPARVISIIISDVIGDRLETIASGLTAPDPSTFSDVAAILRKYKIWDKVPDSVQRLVERGMRGHIPETPKPDDDCFAKVDNVVIGNNRKALQTAAESARSLGFHSLLLTSRIEGEARDVGTVFASIIKEVELSGQPVSPPACLLAGGETTVTIRGVGKGGRNQELALSAAIGLAEANKAVIAAIGTDGADGPTDAAGAIVDNSTISKACERGLDPMDHLNRNDSYSFHRSTGDLLFTGRTGTNVMDLLIGLVC
ncbi:MAG: glycerate kinase [Candidatus Abyssobacteria bacterium SURF_5]|uniref:glycerate 2-kinase n=1 Tax=Abyssobacteria bacterium (strain SURF_5) TaxID=2093360 RepID=A0A3A4NKD7_ABYX5|nr:MAG: glycerate kinase [Candidatus Abyssubacteria bacterium SURF_5]